MSDNILTYFSALGSVGFGWLLNEMGQWFRSRKEDKKIKKKVLFYLLETLHTFKQLDTTQEIDFVTEKVLQRLPKENQNDENKNFMKSLYTVLIPKLFEENAVANFSDLEEGYRKSIEELSLVDPIAAYRLKGKNKIMQTFDQLNNYSAIVQQQFIHEADNIEDKLKMMFQDLKPELVNSAIKDLRDEIKDISYSIGFITNLKAKNITRMQNFKIDKERMERIDNMLNKLMPQAE